MITINLRWQSVSGWKKIIRSRERIYKNLKIKGHHRSEKIEKIKRKLFEKRVTTAKGIRKRTSLMSSMMSSCDSFSRWWSSGSIRMPLGNIKTTLKEKKTSSWRLSFLSTFSGTHLRTVRTGSYAPGYSFTLQITLVTHVHILRDIGSLFALI